MTQTTTSIRFEVGRQYYGISENGRKVMYTVKKVTPKFVTLSSFADCLSFRMRYSEIDGAETVIDEITPTHHYTIRADNPVDTSFVPVATEKKVAHVQTFEEKDRARTNRLLRKYASETDWILRVYRDAMAFMTDEEYKKQYGFNPTTRDKVEEWLYNGETADGTPEATNCFDYARGLNLRPKGCRDDEDFEDRYDELIPKIADIISRIGAKLTGKETLVAAQASENKPNFVPEAMYEDESFSDAPGDNSHPEQDIPEAHMPDEKSVEWTCHEMLRRKKFLKHEIISKNREEIIKMLNKYADIRGTICAIRNGIKTFRKGIRMRVKQGLPSEGLESAIHSAKEEYRELRREGFSLRRKLLRVMSALEIRRACEAYITRCEEIRRRHTRK